MFWELYLKFLSAPSTPIGQRITPTTPQAPGRRGPPTLIIPPVNLGNNNLHSPPAIERRRLFGNEQEPTFTQAQSNVETVVGNATEIKNRLRNFNNINLKKITSESYNNLINETKSSGNKRKYGNISTRKSKRGGKRKSIKTRKSRKSMKRK